MEKGSDSDFRDAEETTTREPDTSEYADTDRLGPGEILGGFGSASLQECVGRVLHNPPQVMSPNVEQNQPQETPSLQPSPDDVPLHPVKMERKKEDVTTKSEASQVGTKEELNEQDSEEPARPEEQEELRRMLDAFRQVPSSESTPRHLEPTRGAHRPAYT